MSKKEFLITGSPRSGTGYMARLFESAGYYSLHEGIFVPFIINEHLDNSVESSWLSAPFIAKLRYEFKKIIHVTRNPLLVINSQEKRKILSRPENPYTLYIYHHSAKLKKKDGSLNNYARFWIEWNEMIEKFVDQRVKIEEVSKNPEKFFNQLEIDTKGRKLYTNQKYNTDGMTAKINLKDIKNYWIRKKLKTKAKEYGYDI